MAKKTTKKVVAKSSKSSAAKAKSVKAPIKKAKVIAKKTGAKKTVAKKVSKPISKKVLVKKLVAKKGAAKATPKKPIAIPAAKKVIVKKTIKPVKKTSAPAKKVVAKTPVKKVVAPVKKVTAAVVPKKIEAPVKASPKPVQKTKKAVQATPKQSGPIHIQVAPPPKQTKEPEGKFEIEYVMHSAVPVLYEMVSTPSGLSEWFCDDVNVRNGICTFFWDKEEQDAKILKEIPERLIRFQWTDHNDGSYFEFRIEQDEMTNDTSLIVTDFALTQEERVSATLLWDSEIDKLKKKIGSIG